MLQVNETHEKIIDILKKKGPSLPINIAKEIDMSSLFISAFLSELADEKRIRVSHMKIGGSPLYYMEGQEEKLEEYYKFLHPKEAEAFLLLKKKKILKDSEQEPAIRVALRSIGDFAFGFKKDEEIYWRYVLVPVSEVKEIFAAETKKKPEPGRPIQLPETKSMPNSQKQLVHKFNNPIVLAQIKPKKEKPKSEFVLKVIDFIKNHYKLVEEKDYKAKEYNCITRINSDLGEISFFTLARDKKNITLTDLKKLLSEAQSLPLPALLLHRGKISKNAAEFADKYSSILKIKKLAEQ
jgi:hypothetical protein